MPRGIILMDGIAHALLFSSLFWAMTETTLFFMGV
jgi:hypothetical protein